MYAHKGDELNNYGVKKHLVHVFALGLRSGSSVPSLILKYDNTTQTPSNVSKHFVTCRNNQEMSANKA